MWSYEYSFLIKFSNVYFYKPHWDTLLSILEDFYDLLIFELSGEIFGEIITPSKLSIVGHDISISESL